MYEKTEYGYRVTPNQFVNRLGRAIIFNDLGLRNDTLTALPSADSLRILCIGDSITFGGILTDQEQTYPYLLQKGLSSLLPSVGKVEVLNASAGGWATENEEGWIRAHGTMGANWVVLQVATHDLFQKRTGSEVVGRHPSFPERQTLFALQEMVSRYLLPRIKSLSHDPGVEILERAPADVRRTLSSIQRISAKVRDSGAQLAVLFVEQPHGLEPNDNLTLWAKEYLFLRLKEFSVPLIRPGPVMEKEGGKQLFRDGMHPNPAGNAVLANEVAKVIHERVDLKPHNKQ